MDNIFIHILTSPFLMVVIAILGKIAANIPQPGYQYPIPNVDDLKTELHTNTGVILRIATFTRSVTVVTNWFVATPPYGWFYNGITSVCAWLPLIKKSSAFVAKI